MSKFFAGMRGALQALAPGDTAPPIGVDFAAQRLNMVQLAVDDISAAPALQAAVSIAYPCERAALMGSPARLKALINSALAQAPFVGRKVYAALPNADVRLLPLTVHVTSGQNEGQAVAKAVREHLGVPLNGSVVDYYRVRSIEGDGPEKQVLAAVADQPKVLAYLALLRSAGVDPVALDIGPSALARLLSAMLREDYTQSVLLINFGVAKSFLTVIWGRRLMIDREIDFGEEQLTQKLARSLGLTPAVALAMLCEHGVGCRALPDQELGVSAVDVGRTIRDILHPEFALLSEELSRTQVYVASRTRGSLISRVYLNGSAARYPNIQARIQESMTLPVDLLDPFEVFLPTPLVQAAAPMQRNVALAVGLALRGGLRG